MMVYKIGQWTVVGLGVAAIGLSVCYALAGHKGKAVYWFGVAVVNCGAWMME